MWKNKHVVVALLVAPVLALMAYFAVDHMVAERPHAAKPGASYRLLAKSNCRYASGGCDLKNGNFEVSLKPEPAGSDRVRIAVESNHPLRVASLGVAAAPGADSEPAPLERETDDALRWSTTIARPPPGETVFQLAVVAEKSSYYAEVPTVFVDTDDLPGLER